MSISWIKYDLKIFRYFSNTGQWGWLSLRIFQDRNQTHYFSFSADAGFISLPFFAVWKRISLCVREVVFKVGPKVPQGSLRGFSGVISRMRTSSILLWFKPLEIYVIWKKNPVRMIILTLCFNLTTLFLFVIYQGWYVRNLMLNTNQKYLYILGPIWGKISSCGGLWLNESQLEDSEHEKVSKVHYYEYIIFCVILLQAICLCNLRLRHCPIDLS